MGIDKNRIRQKLANINNGGVTDYWSPPKDGRATIRMFPYPHGDDPFLDYHFHFNIGKQSILCPKKNGLGTECAICDLATQMYQSDSEQDKEISKKLYARQRFYGTVIDRADETLTPKYWGFSKTLYIKFLTWLQEDNGEYENFLDVQHGLDLVVGVQKTPGKMFAAAECEAKRRESPLAPTQKEIDTILKTVKPASEIFVVMSANEIKAKLDEWVNAEPESLGVEPELEGEPAVVKGKEKKAPRKSPADELESLFEEQLND